MYCQSNCTLLFIEDMYDKFSTKSGPIKYYYVINIENNLCLYKSKFALWASNCLLATKNSLLQASVNALGEC